MYLCLCCVVGRVCRNIKTVTTSFPHIPITIATASLTLADRTKLLEHLSIPKSSCRVISGSLDRPNLVYAVQPVHTFQHKEKLKAVRAFLLRHFRLQPASWRTQPKHTGLIYCATSTHCTDVAKALNDTYGPGYAAAVYGEKKGMDKEMQRAIVQGWMDGHTQVLIATVCFPPLYLPFTG